MTDHAHETVLVEDRGDVLEITINRPAKLNAITQDVVDGLALAYERFELGAWRVAVLTGAGNRAFSAGADFNDPPTNDSPAYPNFGTPLTKPIVSAVEGYAVGAGFVLSQSTDIVVAGESARFGYPEARIGVTGGGATFLTTRVPTKVVADLLLTGRFYEAPRALAAGLVSELVPDGTALDKAREIASLIAANRADAVTALKALIDRDTQRSTIEGAQRASLWTANTQDRSRLRESKGIKGR